MVDSRWEFVFRAAAEMVERRLVALAAAKVVVVLRDLTYMPGNMSRSREMWRW